MRDNKLRKALGQECESIFGVYLNGQLKRTKEEVKDYCKNMEECDLECIRLRKQELKDELQSWIDEHTQL